MDGDPSQSDEELCRRYGVRQCKVCLIRVSKFLLHQYAADAPSGTQENGNLFKIHYGRCFLSSIAKFAFQQNHNFSEINWVKLYRAYIKSEHAALTLPKFREIIKEYFVIHKRDFLLRLKTIQEKKQFQVKQRKRNTWFSKGECKFCVPTQYAKDVEKALNHGDHYRTVLKRLTPEEIRCYQSASLAPSGLSTVCNSTISSVSEAVPCNFVDNPRAVTEQLLRDLIGRTTESIESDLNPDDPLQSSSAVRSLEEQDGDFDSDATEDADFTGVDEIGLEQDDIYTHPHKGMCNGHDSAEDSDSTVPIENGLDNHMSDLSDDPGEETSFVAKNTVRSANQTIVRVPMKL